MASRLRAFARKNPVERIRASSSEGTAAARSGGVGIPAEQLRRHHVDPRVGALGREDRGDEELIGVRMDQGAGRLGILALQRLHDPPGVDLRVCDRIAWIFAMLAGLRSRREDDAGGGPAPPRPTRLVDIACETTMQSSRGPVAMTRREDMHRFDPIRGASLKPGGRSIGIAADAILRDDRPGLSSVFLRLRRPVWTRFGHRRTAGEDHG